MQLSVALLEVNPKVPLRSTPLAVASFILTGLYISISRAVLSALEAFSGCVILSSHYLLVLSAKTSSFFISPRLCGLRVGRLGSSIHPPLGSPHQLLASYSAL